MTLTSLTARLAETIDAHEARLREAPLSTPVTPAEIRAHLARYDFGRACDADELYEDVTQMLWKWAEHARNPRHFGLFRPNVDPLCVIAVTIWAGVDGPFSHIRATTAAQCGDACEVPV